jgi:crotonobetainyl-CoA:carnitine CoA-transferase CaiB-like acyl-CoA transferase
LQERNRSGRGQFVESSLYDSGLSLLHPHAPNWFEGHKLPQLTGNAHPNIYPYDAFKTSSVPLFLAVGNDRQFQLLCKHLNAPALSTDERYATAGGRSVNRGPLRASLEGLFASLEGNALAQDLMAIGVPCAPVLNVQQALEHPHTAHREMVVKIGESYTGLGSPIKLSRTPATYRRPPPD